MKRLFVIVASCVALVCGLVTLVRMARAGEQSPIAVFLTAPDGTPCIQPCLFGVRPGVTPLGEAMQLLTTHPALSGLQVFTPRDGHRGGAWRPQQEGFMLAGQNVSVVVYVDDRLRVSSLDLQMGRTQYLGVGSLRDVSLHTITLGEVVLALGLPQNVLLYKGRGSLFSVVSYYQNAMMLGNAHRSPIFIDSRDRVSNIALTNARGGWNPRGTLWLGFANFWRYFESPDY